VRFGERVEHAHQAVEIFDHLVGGEIVGGAGEADDVGEQDGDGRKVVGDRPFESFKKIIDDELKNARWKLALKSTQNAPISQIRQKCAFFSRSRAGHYALCLASQLEYRRERYLRPSLG
jgi:hypothetical protein